MKVKVIEVHETMKLAFTLKKFVRLVNLRIASCELLILGQQKFAPQCTDELKIHLLSFPIKLARNREKEKLAQTHLPELTWVYMNWFFTL